MNKRDFRCSQQPPPPGPHYPTQHQFEANRRDFLARCGEALAGLVVLALAPGVPLTARADEQDDPDKKDKKKRKKKPAPRPRPRPSPPVPGGPSHPPAVKDPEPR